MSNYRLLDLRNMGDAAMKSIGQGVPLSHHVGRYRMGDSHEGRSRLGAPRGGDAEVGD